MFSLVLNLVEFFGLLAVSAYLYRCLSKDLEAWRIRKNNKKREEAQKKTV